MNITSILFPCHCLFCNDVIEMSKPCCNKCMKYLNIAPHTQLLSNGCSCVSAFKHEGIYRQAVLKYKYRQYKQHYIQFSIILSNIILKCYGDIGIDYYTSIPPHKHKHKNSGRPYDQVKLLAKETARLNKAIYKPLLYQTRENTSQHSLSKADRAANVVGIYKCIDKIDIKNKNILLFDDVVTTGSTLLEGTNELLKCGAGNVFCITINF